MLRSTRTLMRAAPLARERLLVSQQPFSSAAANAGRTHTRTRTTLVAFSGAAAATALWYATRETIQNDAPDANNDTVKALSVSGVSPLDGSLATLVWGSNRNHTLSTDEQTPESVRTPAVAEWLKDVALRDLSLHERHAACVDARGDVYQWGDGFFGSSASASSGKPVLTLRNKNIIRLQTTPDRVFALSASGHIYALSSSQPRQELTPGAPTPASTPWWGTGWMWGEEEGVDFVQITPSEKFKWGERFVSISAGSDHLLALTNTGRTFAHPVNLKANAYGQLGLRKVDVPDHSQPHLPPTRAQLELTPKSVKDPFANSTPAIRRSSQSETSEPVIDDTSIHFSDRLFEIPALQGVKVDQIAAGSRTSFVKTSNGRVLGWGANEFGQIGLGGNITLEAITVPTEVVLWRSTPQTMRTTCLDVYAGGDLTFFKVERTDGSAMPYIDVLACGNGQYGGLGNAQYSNAQGALVRAKNVSGLLEYSEKANALLPIYPHHISVSPTGHVLLTLDTIAREGPGGKGRDLLVWGANQEYQLGNGKRGSLASPTTLHGTDGVRLLLAQRRADVRDLGGKMWKKGVAVEQCAVAGWGNSVVYWRISS